jgi:hypothetical protein
MDAFPVMSYRAFSATRIIWVELQLCCVDKESAGGRRGLSPAHELNNEYSPVGLRPDEQDI